MKRLVVGIILMVLWVSSVLLVPGCGPSEADAAAAREPRDLSFVVVNNSRCDIHSVGLAGANLPMAFSPITKGNSHELKSKNLELPETLALHWTDDRGERHESRVRVWGELGASYSGPVRLTITTRNKVVLTGG